VKSNLTDWCFQNLSRRALNALTVQASTTELGKLTSLENRRIRSDLIETYEIINDYYNIDASLFFQFDEGGKRGHSKKLHKRHSR